MFLSCVCLTIHIKYLLPPPFFYKPDVCGVLLTLYQVLYYPFTSIYLFIELWIYLLVGVFTNGPINEI